MPKKVFIGVGHGGSDPGAVKYIVEKEFTLKTAFKVAEYLKEYGIEYMMSRTADIDTTMNGKVKQCNNYKPDLVVDIHFNAGGGQGFECYRYSGGGVSKTLGENINSYVSKIMYSRGVRTRLGDDGEDYFAIIRETKAPAVLLEGGFVDNEKDANFIKYDYKKLAKAYADGIAKTLGVSKTPKAKILDIGGYHKGDAGDGVLALKCMLLTAKTLGINTKGMNVNGVFGDGTENAVNYLLGRWGYKQTGFAGFNFIKRLYEEINKKVER